MEKFIKTSLPRIHLDSDGTEIDDEDYFQTLEPNTELIAVFSGEQWIDVSRIIKALLVILKNYYFLFNSQHSTSQLQHIIQMNHSKIQMLRKFT